LIRGSALACFRLCFLLWKEVVAPVFQVMGEVLSLSGGG
jgi:hypothetical protein